MSTEPAIRFERLGDRPEAVDLVSRWWFDQWGHESPDMTFERLRAIVVEGLDAVLPVTVLAVVDDAVAGVAELKAHELIDVFPERSPWLGGVYVDTAHRGAGIAAALVREIEALARAASWRRLWLQTEHLDGGLYARLGWQLDEIVERRGRRERVLWRDLDAP